MEVKLVDGSAVVCADEPIHSGAEGELFLTADQQSVIKLYRNGEPNRQQSLDAIINRYNAVREHAYWRSYYCWPDAIVAAPRLGLRMPRVQDGLRDLSWFLLPKSRAQLPPGQRGSWIGHVGMAIRLSRSIRRLHFKGLCHADLSINNCMVNPVAGALTLIDLDGLVVPGLLPPRVNGTPGYQAPEMIFAGAQPSIHTDLHALAVLLYQMLLFRHPLKGPKMHSANSEEDDQLAFGERALYIDHPTDRSNRPRTPLLGAEVLGPRLQGLAQRAFVNGLHNPAERPLANEWETMLVRLYDRLMPCANPACDAKGFPYLEGKAPVCPWCRTSWSSAPELALIDLFRPVPGRSGQYTPDDWQVVGQLGRGLYEWHVYPDRSPGPDSSQSTFADFQYDAAKRQWRLCNRSPGPFRLLRNGGAGDVVASGASVALENGMRIILGDDTSVRLAYVRLAQLSH
jgi:DNA-binding helix-hairpin-helix protein with protein kinase domain